MISQLDKVFKKLGYHRDNGLFILEVDSERILDFFPSRISRILTKVIKPGSISLSV